MAAIDRYKQSQGAWPAKVVSDPPRTAIVVSPSDSVDLAIVAASLYVGVTGDVAVTLADMADGTSVTYKAHPVGYLYGQVKRVWATGTTATNILALD